MVTYNYSVTYTDNSSAIQNVINRIVEELYENPTIERDIVVSIGSGNYAGFYIPDGALYLLNNSAYRLVIKSAGDFFPVIDFNYSSEDQYVGIDIGSGNYNVTIDGLRIQYFAVGVRAGLNSHFPIVKNCIVNNNRNAGIFFEQTEQAQALQNIVINGDYGIVVRLCKSAALIHNTIFMNGAICSGTSSISAVWAELANDYGGGQSDTGVLHLLGNVAWNTTGRCLTLFLSDVESNSIVSNYNNWTIGSTSEYIVVEDNAYFIGNEAQPRRVFRTLTSWKELGYDADSKNDNPRFISPVRIRTSKNGYAVDLNLLGISPVLGMVPSFAYNASAAATWLPSYVDSASFSKDILRANRYQGNTAAGANDKVSTSGFFGQDIFSNPLDLAITKFCATDPFFNILFKTLDIWFPKYNRGYFYSHEREFYLYSRKECKKLGGLAATYFTLPAKISPKKEFTIYANGIKLENESYYDLRSNVLIIYHQDLAIVSGDEEVEIRGYIANWNADAFNYSPVLYRMKFSDGHTRYFLPDSYVPIGPVVVTDDIAYPTDADCITNREFGLVFDDKEQKTEIIFNNCSNLISNGQFDYYDSDGAPYGWQHSNTEVINANQPILAAVGKNVCAVDDGFIRRIVPVDYTGSYTLSFHASSYGSGICQYSFEYYDSNYDLLGYINSGHFHLKDYWSRYSITLGNSGQDFHSLVPQVPYPCVDLGYKEVPTRAAYASIKLEHIINPSYTGTMNISAVQYEEGNVPSLYHRRPFYNELTVEYETSEKDYYVDTHMSISPVTNYLSDGFLHIPELPASIYNGPNSPIITTLHEWKWPDGRINILPWARTKGKDKLRKRVDGKYNLIPENKPEQISPAGYIASVKEILLYPSVPVCTIGDTNGVGIAVKVINTDNNTYGNVDVVAELFDASFKYPGVLSKKIFGLKEILDVQIVSKTDTSGTLSLTWIPPDASEVLYVGPLPTPSILSSTNQNMSFIETSYPVNVENNGNVIILDNMGRVLKTTAEMPIKAPYAPSYGTDYSLVQLAYPPVPGTIQVTVDGIKYLENKTVLLDSNQFFVDYDNSVIRVKGRATNIYIEYLPSYVLVSSRDPYKIMLFHDLIFGTYTDEITLGYDMSVSLNVYINDISINDNYFQKFYLIGQNPLVGKNRVYNYIALDI